jgi:hypothetical protein
VFVAGAEFSLMNRGFLAGDTLEERLARLLGDPRRLPELIPEVTTRVNASTGPASTSCPAAFRTLATAYR